MKRNKIYKLIIKLIAMTVLSLSLFSLVPKWNEINAITKPQKRIVWDLPHSDSIKDVGCEITIDGIRYTEKDISTDISLLVIEKLKNSGVEVIKTREINESKALNSRIKLANDVKADLYISPHINSSPKPAKGVEAFINGDNEVYTLTDNILNDISAKFNTPKRDIVKSPHYNRYINNSILLELGFINGTDLNYLINNKEEIANIIHKNIMKTYQSNEKETIYRVKVGNKQIGAFKNLDNAKKIAKENNGYIEILNK